MSNFDEYKKLGEPDKKEKSEIWQLAIGLQQVDGLTPSDYLIENAKQNIEGLVTIYEVKERLNSYYKSKPTNTERTEEADKVSARIVEVLSEKTFNFSPAELLSIHKKLFEEILDGKTTMAKAGVFRDYNISKDEWVLNGKSVFYASADSILETLKYDFMQEKNFKYNQLSKEELVLHIAEFVSGIWQIHPFGEGNTRTVAIFIIKYLRTLGFNIDNELFEKNSYYFRNALVRANYNDYSNNIFATLKYLIQFFENLLLNKKHELKNRKLRINVNDTVKAKNDTVKTSDDTVLGLIKNNNKITANEISTKLSKGIATIKRELKRLKDNGEIERVGSDKTGYWKVLK
jgi:fido (protein-threonine AMPylation protein)